MEHQPSFPGLCVSCSRGSFHQDSSDTQLAHLGVIKNTEKGLVTHRKHYSEKTERKYIASTLFLRRQRDGMQLKKKMQ